MNGTIHSTGRWRLIGLFPYCLFSFLPLLWLLLTSVKSREASITTSLRLAPESLDGFRRLGDVLPGTGFAFTGYLWNSVVIGLGSTVCAVVLGTACAYGFSRFAIPGAKDWLFFILSTRFMPPLAVVAPVLILFRQFDLPNTHLGLIVLYTAFNLSLAVWLMKGFIDELPKGYEEAALVDGYTRWQAFVRIIIPHSLPGIAVTAVFCLISSWNEYGFAMALNNARAVTVPV